MAGAVPDRTDEKPIAASFAEELKPRPFRQIIDFFG
jgi:hypothetical protein